MGNIGTVFRFGRHYLRRYWTRLAAGVLLGILFGLTNASFVWATKVLIGRMAPPGAFVPATTASLSPPNEEQTKAVPAGKSESGFTAKLKVSAEEVTDPLTCGDCSAVICRRCGTPLESPDELGIG